MSTLYRCIRGPALFALACALFAMTATAIATPRNRYRISGSLSSAATAASDHSGLVVKAALDGANAARSNLQSGAAFALTASLVYAPLVCYGDTIFEDGFDVP